LIKRIILLRRKDGVSREEFKNHWIRVHAEKLKAFKQVKKYVINYVSDSGTGPLYDGVAEMWFENEDSMNSLYASKEFGAFLKEDNPKFQNLEGRWAAVVEELTII
jgi:uncharacterized protein (TIGR02118 family)